MNDDRLFLLLSLIIIDIILKLLKTTFDSQGVKIKVAFSTSSQLNIKLSITIYNMKPTSHIHSVHIRL